MDSSQHEARIGGRLVPALGARTGRRALWIAVVLGVAAAAAFLWWEVFRERQPPIEGEIDERTLPADPLCVGSVGPPCRPIEDVAEMLRAPRLTIRGAEQTTGGNQGVIALAVETPDGARFKAKWRSLDSASMFNTPMKEVAAYRLQSLFLAPRDFVVPPVASHCFPLAHYRAEVLAQAAPLEGADCVFGFLSYWLTEAHTMPEAREAGWVRMPPDGPSDDDPQLLDRPRFESDAVYRRNLAILNLVTHVMSNRDAHAGQFVLYRDPWHAFIVDSSLAFSGVRNPLTLFMQDLSELHVDAIPADVAARLRALRRSDLDVLLAVEEYAVRDRRLERVEPSAPFETASHLRRSGDRLQIGITADELSGVWSRIEALQRALDDGTLRTF